MSDVEGRQKINILLIVKSTKFICVEKCVTAKEVWEIFTNLYQATESARKVKVFKKLVILQFDVSQKFEVEQIKNVRDILDELKEVDVGVSSDM